MAIKVKASITFTTKSTANLEFQTYAQIRYRDVKTGKFLTKQQKQELGLPDAKQRPIPRVEVSRLFKAIQTGGLSENQVAGILKSYDAKTYSKKLKSAQESFFQILDENFNLSQEDMNKFRRLSKRMTYDDYDAWYHQNTTLAGRVYSTSPPINREPDKIRSEDELDELFEKVKKSLKKFYYGSWESI